MIQLRRATRTRLSAHAICLSLLFAPTFSRADFDGAEIDMKKFLAAAKREMAPLKNKPQEVLFEDAAFSTDLMPVFDGAMLFAVGNETSVADKKGKYRLVFRLTLGNAKAGLALARFDENVYSIIVPDAIIVNLNPGTSIDDLKEIAESIKHEVGAQAELTILKALKRVMIDLKNPGVENYLAMVERLNTLPAITTKAVVAHNFEKYRMPIKLGALQTVTGKGRVDLDKLRDVAPQILAEGKSYAHKQSQIPNEFR